MFRIPSVIYDAHMSTRESHILGYLLINIIIIQRENKLLTSFCVLTNIKVFRAYPNENIN